LTRPIGAQITRVTPLTTFDAAQFRGNAARPLTPAPGDYLELVIELDGNALVLGNLPFDRLVPQEPYAIYGLGVGIFGNPDLVERRDALVTEGPAPSYAYVTHLANGRTVALDLTETGRVEISIRTESLATQPSWEITVTTAERLVELTKYRVEIPPGLQELLRERARTYTPPRYLTVRDDHIR
jgi:hypothetical protein